VHAPRLKRPQQDATPQAQLSTISGHLRAISVKRKVNMGTSSCAMNSMGTDATDTDKILIHSTNELSTRDWISATYKAYWCTSGS